MRMRFTPALLFVTGLVLLTQRTIAQESGTGILYGKGHSYGLTAPKGWVLDNSSGVDQGLHAVFYPEGESWSTGKAVMYTNVAVLDTAAGETAHAVMERDMRSMKEARPALRTTLLDTLATSEQRRKAVVQRFDFGQDGNQESVAYIDEGHVLVMVVLTARDKRSHDRAVKAFRDLVASYWWLTANVNIDH